MDCFCTVLHGGSLEPEETYTSLSEYHDYEPSLEFDDSELIQTTGLGKAYSFIKIKKLFQVIFLSIS